MTNLELIKYLIINDIDSFTDFLGDIYALGWNDATAENLNPSILPVKEWLNEDALANTAKIFTTPFLKEKQNEIEAASHQVSY